MLDKLRHPAARKTFIAIVAFAVLVSLVIGYFAKFPAERWYRQNCVAAVDAQTLPTAWWCDASGFAIDLVSRLTVSFISAAFVAILFLAIYAMVRDYEDSTTDVEILFQPEQKRRHYRALRTATFWYHDGHLANWVRRRVLPEFTTRVADDMAVRKIQAAIIDPRSDGACETYLQYVHRLPKEQQRISDITTLKADVCATIFLFCKHYQPDLLELAIYLKREITFFRDDTCDECTFWTSGGKDTPAIFLKNRSSQCHYYNLSLHKHSSLIPKLYVRLDISYGSTALRRMAASKLVDQISEIMRLYFPDNSDFIKPDFLGAIATRVNWGE